MDRIKLFLVTVVIFCPAGPTAAATVRQWVAAVEQAAMASGVVTSSPSNEAGVRLEEAKTSLTAAGVMEEELEDFVVRYARPDVVALARRSQSRYAGDVGSAVTTVKRIFAFLPGDVKNQPSLNTIVLELEAVETSASMKWDEEVLRRLARKYGPGSAKLNGLETLAAYALQRTPGFGLDSTTGYPGPLEVVASYSASYLTRSDDKMRLVSAAEVGLRRYFFNEAWGSSSGRLAWLRPSYMSFGVALSGASDDPLTSPFQGESRVGPFFSWGDIKMAYLVTGPDKRFLITQQFQVIPWVF